MEFFTDNTVIFFALIKKEIERHNAGWSFKKKGGGGPICNLLTLTPFKGFEVDELMNMVNNDLGVIVTVKMAKLHHSSKFHLCS